MNNVQSLQLVELASSCPGLTVTVKCSDLIEAFRLVVNETKLQNEQNHSDSTTETYLTEDEVSEMLGVSHSTLWRWHKIEFLVPLKFGRKNRYRKSTIDAFLSSKN